MCFNVNCTQINAEVISVVHLYVTLIKTLHNGKLLALIEFSNS